MSPFVFVYNCLMSRYFFPRLRDIIFIALFVGALLTGPRMLNTDSDLGRHLTIGSYILNTHQIPTHDLLSFTMASQPRPPYEWLAQVLFAIAYRLLNLDGVVLLTALVIAGTFVIVFADSIRRSHTPLIALLLTIWAALASSLHWLVRPHIFSFLFFAIWVGLLERFRKREKVALWVFPALMLIWVNTHGGFVFGLLAWLAYFAGWMWEYFRKSVTWKIGKQLLLLGGMSLISTVITPDLWHNWNAILNNNSAYILSRTVETMPPDFNSPGIWPFAGLLSLAVILWFLRIKEVKASHSFLLLGLALMSLVVARNIPFFVIASAPILSDWIKQTLAKFNYWLRIEESFANINQTLRGFFWPLVIFLIGTGIFTYHYVETQNTINQFNAQAYPVLAADWMDKHPMQGNTFNDFNWGGYLLYRLWPGQRVFIDSQSDFYGEALTRQSEEILNGEQNWEAKLSQYNVTRIIVPRDEGLVRAAEKSTDWKIAYEDNVAIIFVRR